LLTRGQMEIYDQEREILMRQYRRETGEDWVDPLAQTNDDEGEQSWEYRWADGREGEVMHGPYDGATMRAWNEAGYFLDGVEFRANARGEWSSSVDF
jgi:CD2 antigen cytoplasmic tail-binding protein 2